MVDRVILEIYLTCSLITEQMVVVSFLELYLRAGVPIILRDDCARPVWEESVANPLETLYYTPTCYHTKFRRSRSYRLGVGRGPKNVWGRLDPAP